jgi:Leucine carboxyl methyltransferase
MVPLIVRTRAVSAFGAVSFALLLLAAGSASLAVCFNAPFGNARPTTRSSTTVSLFFSLVTGAPTKRKGWRWAPRGFDVQRYSNGTTPGQPIISTGSSPLASEAANAAVPSSMPNPDVVARSLGVAPIARCPGWVWKFVWRAHGRLLPLLHAFDHAKAKDVDQSLKVLWLKAITSFDRRSPACEYNGNLLGPPSLGCEFWAFNMLPPVSRWIIRIVPTWLFPRLHHANIELRTVYLHRALQKEFEHAKRQRVGAKINVKIRLICLGAGYDPVGTRLLTSGTVDECFELDIESVISSKRVMLQRLQTRRERKRDRQERYRKLEQWPRRLASVFRRQEPNATHSLDLPTKIPTLVSVDLNEGPAVRSILRNIMRSSPTKNESSTWYNVFLTEGVLIYVNDPSSVLAMCADSCRLHGVRFMEINRENGPVGPGVASISVTTEENAAEATNCASLCFADRLANVPGGNHTLAVQELSVNAGGWSLIDWCPKPGLARHMGIARL